MANAIKCDRCGMYFDDPGAYKRLRVNLLVGPNREHSKDLCPQCYKAIEIFIEDRTVLWYSNAELQKGEPT